MAEVVFKNAYITIGGVDLSDHVRQLSISYEAEIQDITAMADNSRARIGGLKNWSVDVEFNQDFAAAKVDATLFALVGTSVALVMRPDAGVVAATNPQFSGSAILASYPPLSGSVGDVHTASVSFQGNGDLTRATA